MPRAPLVVRVAGRWCQGLTGIVAMIGLGAGQFAVSRASAPLAVSLGTMAAFGALALAWFWVGTAVMAGRRWAWRAAVIMAGALLVLLLYAVSAAPQPPRQRAIATAATVVLFGTPVVLLGLSPSRRYFAAPARGSSPDAS